MKNRYEILLAGTIKLCPLGLKHSQAPFVILHVCGQVFFCGCDALNRLLSSSNVTAHAPKTLWNLRDQLQGYRTDPQIIAASDHYELAFREFDRLRTALRLQAAHNLLPTAGIAIACDACDQWTVGICFPDSDDLRLPLREGQRALRGPADPAPAHTPRHS